MTRAFDEWTWRGAHVVVTGASSGIGESIARELAAAGAQLTLVARREDRLRALAKELAGAHVIAHDLGDPERATEWIAGAEAAHGPVDVIVNNAGGELIGATETLEVSAGEQLLRLNLLGPMRIMRALLPGMLARGHGAIVNISSVSALTPSRGYFWYSASKAGLAAASNALHEEIDGSGVRVLTVYPGPVHSEMSARAEAALEQTFWLRHAPYGDSATLARLVRLAVERKQARLIYPRGYAIGRWFPPLASLISKLTAPPPRRLGAASDPPPER